MKVKAIEALSRQYFRKLANIRKKCGHPFLHESCVRCDAIQARLAATYRELYGNLWFL